MLSTIIVNFGVIVFFIAGGRWSCFTISWTVGNYPRPRSVKPHVKSMTFSKLDFVETADFRALVEVSLYRWRFSGNYGVSNISLTLTVFELWGKN